MAIDHLKTSMDLYSALKRESSVDRQVSNSTFWKKLNGLMSNFGVTRVADITGLSSMGFPAAQCCRPHIFSHSDFGQNTGGQGRGGTRLHAKIASAMETLEAFSAEPRNVELIRGSYEKLKRAHVIIDPKRFTMVQNVRSPSSTETLMWTRALSLEHGVEVLVPAQTVFCPFFTADYEIRSLYPSSSNGLAAGKTYRSAIIAALYEVIERHYVASYQNLDVDIEAIYENEIPNIQLAKFKRLMPHLQMQFYNFRLKGIPKRKNLPFIACMLVGENNYLYGYGINVDVDVAIQRAYSEAMQSISTLASGTREDAKLHMNQPQKEIDHQSTSLVGKIYRAERSLPNQRTLKYENLKKALDLNENTDFNDEYGRLMNWCHSIGFKNVLVVNLTRVGIDIPVVRVLVPGAKMILQGSLETESASIVNIIRRQFRISS